jgi:tRNA (guanine-N7-)-methyltransferase
MRTKHSTLQSANPIEYIPPDYFRALDLNAVFPRNAPLALDLGCGDGSFLVAMAQLHPDRNYLGTERLIGRVRNTCRKAMRAALTNIRLIRVESAYLIEHLLPPKSVSRIYIMFPDPWPKRRHWPRRLVQPEFLLAASRVLAPGGELCIKTDDADYFQWVMKMAAGIDLFTPADWKDAVPMTDFERHYTAEGRTFHAVRLIASAG